MRARAAALAAPFIVLLAAACRTEESPQPVVQKVPGQVLTIRTVIPGERSFLYFVGVSGGKVRLGSETDQWRLIDVRNRTVTFIDETRKTYRTEPLASLLEQRRDALRRRAPDFLRTATIEPLKETRTFAGFPATGYRITMGAYEREIWLSYRSIIAPEFLSLYLASEPLNEQYSGAMREAYGELLALQGFPVYERSTMPLGDKQMVIERTLVSVAERPVPAVWFEIPAEFRNLTPAAAGSPAGRPPASSTPRGQTTPAEE